MEIDDYLEMGKSKKRLHENNSSDSSVKTSTLRLKMADSASKKDGNAVTRITKKIRTSDGSSTEVPLTSSRKQEIDVSSHAHAGTQVAAGHKVQELYDGNHRAPFHVFLRSVASDKDNAKSSFLEVSRKLYKSNIKYKECVPQSKNCWKISFDTRSEANSAISNRFLKEMGFEAYIPKSQLYRKGIVRDIPLDASMEEIVECVNRDNGKTKATSAFRLRRKEKSSGEWVDSYTVCIEFKGQELPDSILLWRVRLFVAPYIPTVRMCFKCGRTGHISKFCSNEERCLTCAGDHGVSKGRCEEMKKCINCAGNHETRDRACPVLVKKKAIVRVMAIDNVTYAEANRIISRINLNGSAFRERLPLKTSKNFPSLPVDNSTLPRDLNQRDLGDRHGLAAVSYADKASSSGVTTAGGVNPKIMQDVLALLEEGSLPSSIKEKIVSLLCKSNFNSVPSQNG